MFDARKLLDEMMGAGATSRNPGSGGHRERVGQVAGDVQSGMRQGAAGEPVAGGGFASVIGGVLGQAGSGMKDAARGVEARTGVAGKANEALKEATGGQGAGDLLARARELASQNKLATGAAHRRPRRYSFGHGSRARPRGDHGQARRSRNDRRSCLQGVSELPGRQAVDRSRQWRGGGAAGEPVRQYADRRSGTSAPRC